MSEKKEAVSIIGAGYAGLCAARHLRDQYEVTIFERQGNVGGLWNYSPDTGLDAFGKPVHSAMYKNVRTNFPKNIMDFPDFRFGKSVGSRSFVKHEEVLAFLNQYADHFRLTELVRFNSFVESVKPIETTGRSKWELKVMDRSRSIETFTFDKVFVCTGHFSKPNIPSNFVLTMTQERSSSLEIFHSHDYREPEVFRNKTVCVVGAGPSGIDISTDIAKFAEKVVMCHNKNRQHIPFPDNVIQKPKVAQISYDFVVLESGEEIRVDSVLLCTGYQFEFPFFHDSVPLNVEENCVTPLFKQLIHMGYPKSLFFVGLQRQVAQGYLIHTQMKYILNHLKIDSRSVKSEKEVIIDELTWMEKLREVPKRKLFKLGTLFRDYVRMLEDEIELPEPERIPEVILNIFEDVISHHDVCTLRESNYVIVDDENFVTVPAF